VLPLPLDDYLAAHIPGAAFFDVDAVSDHNDPRPHMYPDAGQFARDVAALGISAGDTVVAYDSGSWVAAPRAWWMFLSFGYRNVKVLDGGLKKWTSEGRATQSGKVTPKPGQFAAKLDPGYIRSQQQVIANIETRAEQPYAAIKARVPMSGLGGLGARLGEVFASLSARGVAPAGPPFFKYNVIDYGRVLQVMAATGYAGYVGVEYVWIDWEHCNEVDNLVDEPGVTGHKSELMMSPASRNTWRGFSLPSVRRRAPSDRQYRTT